MARANGLHHLAFSTGNMKAQIEFFSDLARPDEEVTKRLSVPEPPVRVAAE